MGGELTAQLWLVLVLQPLTWSGELHTLSQFCLFSDQKCFPQALLQPGQSQCVTMSDAVPQHRVGPSCPQSSVGLCHHHCVIWNPVHTRTENVRNVSW